MSIPRLSRAAVISRAAGRCEKCGERARLQLHHLHYESVGRETPEDLTALCDDCHRGCHHDLDGNFWRDPREKEWHWEAFWDALSKDD